MSNTTMDEAAIKACIALIPGQFIVRSHEGGSLEENLAQTLAISIATLAGAYAKETRDNARLIPHIAIAQEQPGHDAVDHPAHYNQGGIECIDAIEAALGPDGFVAFCRGSQIKYNWRTGLKDDAIQEQRKAAWYADRAAKAIEKKRMGGTK